MPTDTEVLASFGLRTSPFAPSIGRNGQPIAPGLFDRALDPTVTPDVLAYYFDFYEWGKGPIKGISGNSIFEQFPPHGGSQSTLVLVSGNSRSGRKSIVNRIIKKIAVDDELAAPGEKPPLVVPVTFLDKDRDENIGAVAELLVTMFEIEHPGAVADILRKQLSAATAQKTMTAYAGFFQKYKLFTPPVTRRSVVFRVTADKEDFNSWAAAYAATRTIARCTIVETGSPGEADATVNLIRSGSDSAAVVHIRAAQLKHDTAREYISARIKDERTTSPTAPHGNGDIAPFTDAAVAELFAPTKEGHVVGLPIGRVRKTLNLAMERHIAKIKKEWERQGAAGVAALPPNELSIGKSDMRLVCDLISQGLVS
jgi:hypothetical protein